MTVLDGIGAFAFLLFAGTVVRFVYLHGRLRTQAMMQLAARNQMTWLGTTLPKRLTLNRTELWRAHLFYNVFDGDCRGTRTVVFDCQIGEGKGSSSLTAIAIESDRNLFANISFELSTSTTINQSGKWFVLYPVRGRFLYKRMAVGEVELYLEALKLQK